jgi:hypothetical protein
VWDTRDALVEAWTTRFDALVAFYGATGTFPPFAEDLGKWVNRQRTSRETMPTERKARLESLPWWVWNSLDAAWSTKFDEVVAYHAEHGRIPSRSTPGGLATWISEQRTHRETMPQDRKARLESLPWWAWSVRAAPVRVGWSARLDELVAFYEANGRLPPFAAEGGLGTWVDTQRQARQTMPTERKARLESLAWWVWDTREDAWCTKFDELVAYHAEHGRFPAAHAPGGLGMWVNSQRQARAAMSTERSTRLEALGWWVWNSRDDAWSTKFDEVVAFYEANGTLPSQSAPGGLGAWVRKQRHARATMPTERKARLESLPWWVWDTLGA